MLPVRLYSPRFSLRSVTWLPRDHRRPESMQPVGLTLSLGRGQFSARSVQGEVSSGAFSGNCGLLEKAGHDGGAYSTQEHLRKTERHA